MEIKSHIDYLGVTAEATYIDIENRLLRYGKYAMNNNNRIISTHAPSLTTYLERIKRKNK